MSTAFRPACLYCMLGAVFIMKLYRLECLTEDGDIECNGYYINKENAEKAGAEMDEYPMNKKYGIIQQIIEIEGRFENFP